MAGSKKLYEDVAARIRALPLPEGTRELISVSLSSAFKNDNDKFDEDRFRAACRTMFDPSDVDMETIKRLVSFYFDARSKDPSLPPIEQVIWEIAEGR